MLPILLNSNERIAASILVRGSREMPADSRVAVVSPSVRFSGTPAGLDGFAPDCAAKKAVASSRRRRNDRLRIGISESEPFAPTERIDCRCQERLLPQKCQNYVNPELSQPSQLLHRPISEYGFAIDEAFVDGTEVAAVVGHGAMVAEDEEGVRGNGDFWIGAGVGVIRGDVVFFDWVAVDVDLSVV